MATKVGLWLLAVRQKLQPVPRDGQAALETGIGKYLYELSKQDDVARVLEIGTWSGRGSTYCIARGLRESGGRLISVESSAVQYRRAVSFYRTHDLPVELIHGSSVTPEEFPPLADLEAMAGPVRDKERWPAWYRQDVHAARSAHRPGVLRDLLAHDAHFDLVYLDGGEFTSYTEFRLVKDRTRYLVLDDCTSGMVVKNVRSRDDLLHDPAWELLYDEPADRNGWCAFRRIAA